MRDGISFRQLKTLCFVAMLSPLLRLQPAVVAEYAGSAAWVSGGLALIPAVLLVYLLGQLQKSFPQNRGLSHQIIGILGPFGGKILILLWSAWLVFHSGFLLRSGADRFIATIYPESKPLFFVIITALLCTVAAFGHIKPLARSAEIFRPLLLFVILLVLIFTLGDVEPTFLLPVTSDHIGGIAKGIPVAVEAVSVVLVIMAFLGFGDRENSAPGSLLLWLLGGTVLSVLLCGISVGSLGKTYTTALAYPFFIMARDLSILSGVERIEALVVGLWLLPDFILITLELIIAADNLQLITRRENSHSSRRGSILTAGLIATVTALTIAPNSEVMQLWSDEIVPAIQLGWSFLVIPLLLIVGRLRQKF